MNKTKLKKALKTKTHCTIQHTGWPCRTCFVAIDKGLTNQDWQALLLFRGDYKREDLDNLPADITASLDKIYQAAVS